MRRETERQEGPKRELPTLACQVQTVVGKFHVMLLSVDVCTSYVIKTICNGQQVAGIRERVNGE